MNLLLNFILLSLFVSSFGLNDVTVVNRKNVFLNRKKRYLTFPPGSNFVIEFSGPKAFIQRQPSGWNMVAEMACPFALPSDTRMFRRKNWIDRTKREMRSSLDQGLTKSGFNGTACVNKMICDMKRYVPMKGNSMIKDILLAVFSDEEFNYEEECQYSDSKISECPISILDYVLKELNFDSA
ncbi:unnamed protein product [Phaedon cochleariae]|uniref:Uncharacterized protein n=1 Tax=Phaedon cochleariae TaxID=80249 RepID=A0A9N9SCV5_PHACE|nr:unnamed protein product [Phaedon cochleariae]